MFLLFQLLNYRVVSVQWQLIDGSWQLTHVRADLRDAAPQFSENEDRKDKCKPCRYQHQTGAYQDRICEQSHSSPQYQCMTESPKNRATKAMLPRKTPNGIS